MNQISIPLTYLYKICLNNDLDHQKFSEHFEWWSQSTFEEDLLMDKTVDDLKKSLFTIFVYTEEGELVGAAGIFPCIDKLTGDYIFDNGRLLCEVGSVFVVYKHRKKGIGGTCVKMRLDFCEKNEITPFMVTQDIVMTQKVLKKSNMEKIDLSEHAHFTQVCLRIKCICREVDESNGNLVLCTNCHLHKKSRVGFKRFEQYY